METNRKSFVIHFDSLDVIEDMTDEQVGRLFRKMKSYHNGNTYISSDKIADIAFSAFKNQFDRDIKNYERVCERNRNNGLKGGRPSEFYTNPKEPTGLSGFQEKPKKPDSKSKSKSNNNSDSNTQKEKQVFPESEKYPLLSEKLMEFERYRKKMKKPIKEESAQLFLKNLLELSGGDELKSIAILEQSIANSWQGIFELKSKNPKLDSIPSF